ncbi:MAG: hypothetical protein UV95_C0003G0112 [Candidatus Falkowbacteria bacterium GW2011_GWF2_43_32]|nr:MAG: hypothetical protein UV95_C0003G0112 [Candidatus Falkowbacteria bacterium GW2011_GWF2_43_32]
MKHLREKTKKIIALYAPYLFVILAIVLPWFFRPGYLFFTDSAWGPLIKFDWTSTWLVIKFLLHGLSFIIPADLLEKIFITAVLSLILFGGRSLVKNVLEYFKENDSSDDNKSSEIPQSAPGLIFILSLFALFNPFVYDRALYGQFGVLISYGALLFVLAYLLETWRTLNFKKSYQAAIFTAISLMFAVHFIFFLIPFYLLFFGGLFVRRREIKTAGQLKKLGRTLIISLFIILFLNANWLIALALKVSPTLDFVEQGITNQDLIAFQTAGANDTEVFTNVLLMSGFWGKDQFRYFDLTDAPGWQRSFIFLALLIIYGVGLSFYKRHRVEKFFSVGLLLIFVLAVFLAVGIKTPLTRGLSLFLYDHLPFYKGLRESQKWVAVIVPIYLFYLTVGVGRLKDFKLIKNKSYLSAILLSAVIIMQAPSLLWGFGGQIRPTSYPADWHEVNELLLERSANTGNCSDKVLFLPWHLYMSFNWTGKIVANPAPQFFSCPTQAGTNMEWGGIYDNSQKPDSLAVSAWIRDRGVSGPPPVYDEKKFRYIILAKELDWRDYSWLSEQNYLNLILETETLLFYEIKY